MAVAGWDVQAHPPRGSCLAIGASVDLVFSDSASEFSPWCQAYRPTNNDSTEALPAVVSAPLSLPPWPRSNGQVTEPIVRSPPHLLLAG